MSDKLILKNNNILPKELGEMTLNQLFSQNDVEVKKKNNKTMLKKVTPTETISMEISTYIDGITISQSKFNMPQKKKDLKNVAKQLKKEGRTQTEIADLLGTTQPYVSKLLKEK